MTAEVIENEPKTEERTEEASIEAENLTVVESSPSTEATASPAREDDLEKKLKRMVVNDLLNAIGINEKYLYASELFKGDIQQFTNALHHLNHVSDQAEAMSYLEELAGIYDWDADNSAVISFRELIENHFDQY